MITPNVPVTLAKLTDPTVVFNAPLMSVVPSVDQVSPTCNVTLAITLKVPLSFNVTVMVLATVSVFAM